MRNELAARRLPGKKIGKEWRLSRTALIAYLSTPGMPRMSRGRSAGEQEDADHVKWLGAGRRAGAGAARACSCSSCCSAVAAAAAGPRAELDAVEGTGGVRRGDPGGQRAPATGCRPPVLAAQLHQESGWDPMAVSPVGRRRPGAVHAGDLAGVRHGRRRDGRADPRNPIDAIWSAAGYDCVLKTAGRELPGDLIRAHARGVQRRPVRRARSTAAFRRTRDAALRRGDPRPSSGLRAAPVALGGSAGARFAVGFAYGSSAPRTSGAASAARSRTAGSTVPG